MNRRRFNIVRGGLWLPRRIFGAPRTSSPPKLASASEWRDPTDPNNLGKLRIVEGWVRFFERHRIAFTQFQHLEDPQRTITTPHVAMVLALSASQQLFVIANRDTWHVRAECERAYKKLRPRTYVHEEDADLRVVLGFGAGRFKAFGGPRGWYDDLGLYQCAACESWYFVDESGGWACQCNGCDYSGNADILGTFSGHVPREFWERAS